MLQTYPATIAPGGLTFAATVPGQYRWRVLSVLANAARVAGGTNIRSFQLTVLSGVQPIATVSATDVSPDPGDLTVCWAQIPAGSITVVGNGAQTIPAPRLVLDAGYVLRGTIAAPVAGDHWLDAVVWVDQDFIE